MAAAHVLQDELIDIRRDLHQHPELSWHEERTAQRIATHLEAAGIDHRAGIAGTGVLAELPGPPDSPIVALRADIDALPIQEETGLPFASVHEGAMHACAHDGHTAILIGALRLLQNDTERPFGVRGIFQPAEEVGRGALAMIDGGALDGVGMVFGGHIDCNYPGGVIVPHLGAVNASTDTFTITVQGQGGHAARPHEGADAIVAASQVVLALQTIASRELNPADPVVVTVGRFDAGTASNVLAGRASLAGTIRALSPDVRDRAHAAVRRLTTSVAQAHRTEATVEIERGTPAVINTEEMTGLAQEAAEAVVGPSNVRSLLTTNMGGEDFAYYLERVPGCFVRYGALPTTGRQPAHSSRFDFDEQVLAIGAQYLREVATRAGTALLQSSA